MNTIEELNLKIEELEKELSNLYDKLKQDTCKSWIASIQKVIDAKEKEMNKCYIEIATIKQRLEES